MHFISFSRKTLVSCFILALGSLVWGRSTGDVDQVQRIVDEAAPNLLQAAKVPGMSVALIQNHKVTWLGQYGLASVLDSKPVTADTIFEAASMSKPAFAYVFLQFVEKGKMDLDRPLADYWDKPYIENEVLHLKITGRIALSHQTGFPNWRKRGAALAPQFEPGTKYHYSGEGFLYLQRTLERVAGASSDSLTHQFLLDPLHMDASSYVWRPEYTQTAAAGHDKNAQIPEKPRLMYRRPNSAYTLYTTPAEYAKFLIEMMKPENDASALLSYKMRQQMLQPISSVPDRNPTDRGDDNTDGKVYFGLGWRIESTPKGWRYCHSGSNGTGFRCYSEFIPDSGNGIVIMTNGMNGAQVWQQLMRVIGDKL